LPTYEYKVIPVTIERSMELFYTYCRSKQLRPKTMQAYRQGLELFAAWLQQQGIEHVTEIREMTIRSYILNLQERGKYAVCADECSKESNHPEHRSDYLQNLSNVTINGYLRYIRVYLNWMVENDILDRSPMRRIKLLKQQRQPKDYLNDEEVKLLLRMFDRNEYQERRDMMVAMLMLDSGTRIGETLAITMDKIDLHEQTVFLPAENTKGKKDRTVFFSKKVARELRAWIRCKEEACDSLYLFPVKSTGYKLKISNYEANFRRYMARTGIDKKVSPHTLRNNFAKRCLMSGMDIYTLSRILGHSSIKITERNYLDITDEDLKLRYAGHSPMDNLFFRD